MAQANEYDAVVKARKFGDVYDPARGWRVESPDDLKALGRDVHTIRVSPIGHFNVGKTHVTNRLSGRSLATGEQHHTEGLSVALTPFAKGEQQIAWLDTAGLNSPVVHSESLMSATSGVAMKASGAEDPRAASEHTQQLMASLQAELREVKRLEEFHRAVAFEFADVFLFVIGEMSHEDQLNIMLLVRQIEQAAQRGGKHVFVVHNLKDWDLAQLRATHDDGYTYAERVRALFFMQELTVTATGVVDDNNDLVVEGKGSQGQERPLAAEIKKLYGTFGQSSGSSVPMHHVFLCDDAREKPYNSAVLAHVRSALTGVLPNRESVQATLERVMTGMQGQFADVARDEVPPLRFAEVDGAWRMHSVKEGAPATCDVASQPLELQSYLTLGSDDLQYNVVKMAARAPAANPGIATKKKFMAGVQIVLPGMTPQEVDAVRARVRFTGTDPALRLEHVEGVRTLMVDLEAVEHVMPKGFALRMQQAAEQQVDEGVSEAGILIESTEDVVVVDEGTRAVFDKSLSRPVRVQVRTGLTNVSALTKPVVTYNDGVLSIMVMMADKMKTGVAK